MIFSSEVTKALIQTPQSAHALIDFITINHSPDASSEYLYNRLLLLYESTILLWLIHTLIYLLESFSLLSYRLLCCQCNYSVYGNCLTMAAKTTIQPTKTTCAQYVMELNSCTCHSCWCARECRDCGITMTSSHRCYYHVVLKLPCRILMITMTRS